MREQEVSTPTAPPPSVMLANYQQLGPRSPALTTTLVPLPTTTEEQQVPALVLNTPPPENHSTGTTPKATREAAVVAAPSPVPAPLETSEEATKLLPPPKEAQGNAAPKQVAAETGFGRRGLPPGHGTANQSLYERLLQKQQGKTDAARAKREQQRREQQRGGGGTRIDPESGKRTGF